MLPIPDAGGLASVFECNFVHVDAEDLSSRSDRLGQFHGDIAAAATKVQARRSRRDPACCNTLAVVGHIARRQNRKPGSSLRLRTDDMADPFASSDSAMPRVSLSW